jgi:hypothetical protein
LGFTVGSGIQPASAQQPVKPVSFAEGRISFFPPPGFTSLTADEIAVKFPRAGAPRLVVGNARRTTTIAYDVLDATARDFELDLIRQQLAASFEGALPTLKWVVNGLRRMNNRGWAHLEFTAPAADQDLHNIVLASVYDGHVVIFNFNSTVAEFPRVEQGLRDAISSIVMK